MSGGRPRTPTKLLLLRGSKRAEGREHEPQPPQTIPRPPAWLCPKAKTKWRYLVGKMKQSPGWVTSVDGDVLADHCQARADIDELTRELRREGRVFVQINRQGDEYTIRNPKQLILKDAHTQATKTACELGLTPASRSKVKAVPAKTKEDDPWDEI